MKRPPYYSPMASGNLAIVLDVGVDYDSFDRFAEKWIARLLLIVTKKINGPGERIWECEQEGFRYWLAYDDWFPLISLEPRDAEAGNHILSIGRSLGLDSNPPMQANP